MSEGVETHTAEDGITYQKYNQSEDPRWHPQQDDDPPVCTCGTCEAIRDDRANRHLTQGMIMQEPDCGQRRIIKR